jgi:hypothetical protein
MKSVAVGYRGGVMTGYRGSLVVSLSGFWLVLCGAGVVGCAIAVMWLELELPHNCRYVPDRGFNGLRETDA